MKVDPDHLLAVLDEHRGRDGSVDVASLAGALGVSPQLARYHVKRLAGHAPADKRFRVPEGHVVKGVSALVDEDGREVQKWIKTQAESAAVSLTREAVMEAVSDWKGKSEILLPPTGCDPTRLALLPTADIHLGLLAWGKDSARDWDLDIARRELLSATSELIQLTPACQTAILLDLGDQFHMNDQSNATPAHGHRLDVDGRFPKVAKAGVKIRRAMIELALQRFERVIYRGVRGNHDPEAQMWLSIALAEFFENNPRVTIDDDPSSFWHFEFGKTFLFANHGDKVKPDRLPGLMAADHPEIWGRTKHKYAFSGHIHRERSGEELGVRWETLRTINPGDNYSFTGGWRSGHELTSITYSAETGQRHRQFVPV